MTLVNSQSFVVPADVSAFYANREADLSAVHTAWEAMFSAYSAAHPDLSAEYVRRFEFGLPENWDSCLPTYSPEVIHFHYYYISNYVLRMPSKLPPGTVPRSPSML